MAVLAIAHHNLAVEQEALRLPEEATRSFGEAASIAAQQLGEEHPVATALRSTFEANLQQREAPSECGAANSDGAAAE